MSLRLILIMIFGSLYLSGCSTVERSMLFFTRTTIGIEASTGDPSTPVEVVAGYKRAEGVINPVYDSAGIGPGTSSKYRDEAYSVLATIRGEGSASAPAASTGSPGNVGTKIQGGQWFATGEAAKILARQPGIAGAISGSPDIAEAEAKIRSLALGIPADDDPIAIDAMRIAYNKLKPVVQTSTRALNLKRRLDAVAASLRGTKPYTQYNYNAENHSVQVVTGQRNYDPQDGFNNVLDHWDELTASINALSSLVTYWNGKSNPPDNLADKRAILASQKRDQKSFLQDWGNRKEVIDLIEWLIANLKGEL